MGISDRYQPTSGSATDRWENWMDVVELAWCETMEAARHEYAQIRDDVQAKRLKEIESPTEKNSRPARNESSAK